MGNLIPFHLLFTEIAERETRNFTLLGQHGAPSKTYGLLEAYCPDPTCDCRRVMINVVDVDHLEDGYLAAISFGFDRDADMAGPFLDPLNPQSPFANMLLEHVIYVLSDPTYVRRLERHYDLVKAAASPPTPHTTRCSPGSLMMMGLACRVPNPGQGETLRALAVAAGSTRTAAGGRI